MSLYSVLECDQWHHLEWHWWPESFQDSWPQGHREDVFSVSETAGLDLLTSALQYSVYTLVSPLRVCLSVCSGKLTLNVTLWVEVRYLALIPLQCVLVKVCVMGWGEGCVKGTLESPKRLAPGYHEQLSVAECFIVEMPQSTSFALVSAEHFCEGDWLCLHGLMAETSTLHKSWGVTIQETF